MKAPAKESRRQELLAFADTGRLRQACEARLSAAAADLLVDVVIRYCESRPKRARSAKAWR